MKEVLIGFFIGFGLCIFLMSCYHSRIAKRGYMSIHDKLYDVKIREIK